MRVAAGCALSFASVHESLHAFPRAFLRALLSTLLLGPLLGSLLASVLGGCGLSRPAQVVVIDSPFSGTVVPGPRVQRLLAEANREWRRWGGQIVTTGADGRQCAVQPDGQCLSVDDGCGREQDLLWCPVVDEYWRSVADRARVPFAHDCGTTGLCAASRPPGARYANTPAWSAAFIGTLMRRAGFSDEDFLATPYHVDYVIAARDGRTRGWSLETLPAWTAPGDLLCSIRSNRPPDIGRDASPDTAKRERIDALRASDDPRGPTPMHCDLVVAVDLAQGTLAAIGGNVMQSVSLVQWTLDPHGRMPLRDDIQNPPRFLLRMSPWLRGQRQAPP